MTSKIAFIHIPKTAGRSVDAHLRHELCEIRKHKTHYVNHRPANMIKKTPWVRNFTEEELLAIAADPEPRQYFRNHTPWSPQAFRAFKQNGWFTFAFTRPLGDLLCSWYAYMRENGQEKDVPVDQCLNRLLDTDLGWLIPGYYEEIDFIRPFTRDSFAELLSLLDLPPCEPPHVNASGNPGYESLCREGAISKTTQKRIEEHPQARLFLETDPRTRWAAANGTGAPLVSIVLPSHNYARLLPTALESVKRQRYPNWELVAVDDGSSDDSLGILRRFADQEPAQARLFTHPGRENRGLSRTIALALEHCRGEFVALLEADDALHPESIDRRVGVFVRRPDAVAVHHALRMQGEPPQVLSRWRELAMIRFPRPGLYEALPFLLRSNVVLSLSGLMVRRQALHNVNLEPPNDPWFDWWLLAQLCLKGPFYYLDRELASWTIHVQSYNARYTRQNDPLQTLPRFLAAMRALMESRLADDGSPNPRLDQMRRLYAENREADALPAPWVQQIKKTVPRPLRQAIKRAFFV